MEIKDSKFYLDKLAEMPAEFQLPDGSLMEIPPQGALGLLAIGAIGIYKWKQKQKELGLSYKDYSEEFIEDTD